MCMKKLKCFRRAQSKGFSIPHNAVRAARFWLPAPDFLKNMFFAKRTQSYSMFTGDFEKTRSQLKPIQTQLKPIFDLFKANSPILRSSSPPKPWRRGISGVGTSKTPAHEPQQRMQSKMCAIDLYPAVLSRFVRFASFGATCSALWLLASDSWILQKNIFWKNEAKLCTSLLSFFKKRTQNEPEF
jgi:hypothetical protein